MAASGSEENGCLSSAWIGALLEGAEHELDPAVSAKLLRGCGSAHYRAMNIEATAARYRGDLPAFVGFLSTEWHWKVSYDRGSGIILADEDKPDCVCPLAKGGAVTSPLLCRCSEGFAELLFAAVVGRPVRATVVRSILRGDPSCVYRVETAHSA